MDSSLFVVGVVIAGLLVLDLLSLAFGVDSRPVEDTRPNW